MAEGHKVIPGDVPDWVKEAQEQIDKVPEDGTTKVSKPLFIGIRPDVKEVWDRALAGI